MKIATEQGSYFLKELKKIESPILKQIRGKGLWIGVEIDTKIINGRNMCKHLLKKGILSKETHASTIRFAPPLSIKKKEIDWAINTIKEALKEIERRSDLTTTYAQINQLIIFLLIKPASFYCNEQTKETNLYQNSNQEEDKEEILQ